MLLKVFFLNNPTFFSPFFQMNATIQRKAKLLMPLVFYLSLLVLVAQVCAVVTLFAQSLMPLGMWFLLVCIAILAGMFCYTAVLSNPKNQKRPSIQQLSPTKYAEFKLWKIRCTEKLTWLEKTYPPLPTSKPLDHHSSSSLHPYHHYQPSRQMRWQKGPYTYFHHRTAIIDFSPTSPRSLYQISSQAKNSLVFLTNFFTSSQIQIYTIHFTIFLWQRVNYRKIDYCTSKKYNISNDDPYIKPSIKWVYLCTYVCISVYFVLTSD